MTSIVANSNTLLFISKVSGANVMNRVSVASVVDFMNRLLVQSANSLESMFCESTILGKTSMFAHTNTVKAVRNFGGMIIAPFINNTQEIKWKLL